MVALVMVSVACGPVRIEGPPTEHSILTGPVRLHILEPSGNPQYRHSIHVAVAGRPSLFEYNLYVLAVMEGTAVRLLLIQPGTQRVFRFGFVPENAAATVVCQAVLFELKGFDIYGLPIPGEVVYSTHRLFSTNLLTFEIPRGTVDWRGKVWEKLY